MTAGAGDAPAADAADAGLDAFPRQHARTRGFTLGRPRSFTVAPDGRVAFLRSAAGDDPMMRLWVLDPAGHAPRLVADPAALHGAAQADATAAERARRERVRESASGITSYATDARVHVAAFTLGARLYLADLTANAADLTGDLTGPSGRDGGAARDGHGRGGVRELPVAGEAHDPRPDPTGARVAYVGGGGRHPRGLYVVDAQQAPATDGGDSGGDSGDGGGGAARRDADADAGQLAGDADPNVSWGVAEFIAAEEMGRTRGFWWSPDGTRLAAARVDTSRVPRWFLADPAMPHRQPLARPYPAAGTVNAQVRLFVLDLSGGRVEVTWDAEALPYLLDVSWKAHAPLTLAVQSRDQRTVRVLAADADTGATRVVHTQTDAAWVSLPGGLPRWVPPAPGQPAPGPAAADLPTRGPAGARLLTSVDDSPDVSPDDSSDGDSSADTAGTVGGAGVPDAAGAVAGERGGGTRRLALDGRPLTPPGLQVRRVLAATATEVVFLASQDATSVQVWRATLPGGEVTQLTGTGHPAAGGAGTAAAGGRDGGGSTVLDAAARDAETLVVTTTGLAAAPETVVRRPGGWVRLPSAAHTPLVTPRPRLLRAGRRRLHTALLLPAGRSPGDGRERLPVLLDPYGGPGAQRVVASRLAYATPQWFADQGFAVLVTDGRGTPGRGPAWERAVAGDLLGPPLEDQVDALHAVAGEAGVLDLGRVAIRGWSFGGYLAAAAVLRRPDVFHAAVAGAPVTEWRLYDTHYTERYLGHPDTSPQTYDRCSLLGDAASLRRPLLLVHGLADDNVVAAHTLRLSAALLAAGRPHTVLPLSGVTHMTPQPQVAANLLTLQLAFLRSALGLSAAGAAGPPETVTLEQAGTPDGGSLEEEVRAAP